MLLKLSIISCVLIMSQSLTNALGCNGNNYTEVEGLGWYKLHPQSKNWSDASKICENEGAHLAIVNSEEENAAIIEMIEKESFNIVDASRSDIAWLGGHKAIVKTYLFSFNGWSTVLKKSLSSTGYKRWSKGCYGYPPEPNNYNGDENCLSVFLYCDHGLNDHSCDQALPFVCEKLDTCENDL